MKNCNIVVVKVTYAQPFVFKMESVENPLQPCEVEKRNLDFDAIVQEINERQEEIKKHLRENDKIDNENEEKNWWTIPLHQGDEAEDLILQTKQSQ